MTSKLHRFLKCLSFDHLKERIKHSNPLLCRAMEKVAEKVKVPLLYLVSYLFGDRIVKNGGLQLPNSEGELVSVYDPSISNEIRDQLTYTDNMPICLILEGAMEVFLKKDHSLQRPWGGRWWGEIYGTCHWNMGRI